MTGTDAEEVGKTQVCRAWSGGVRCLDYFFSLKAVKRHWSVLSSKWIDLIYALRRSLWLLYGE